MARIGFDLGGAVFSDFRRNICMQGRGGDITSLRKGGRVWAVKKIYHPNQAIVIIDTGTQGTVEVVGPGQGFVGVSWDIGLLFSCSVTEIELLDWELGGMRPALTKSQMLAFQSIFDLLTQLGFEEDPEDQRMVDRGVWLEIDGSDIGDHAIGFEQIAGRTVAEFVREGLQKGFLLDYLRAD